MNERRSKAGEKEDRGKEGIDTEIKTSYLMQEKVNERPDSRRGKQSEVKKRETVEQVTRNDE